MLKTSRLLELDRENARLLEVIEKLKPLIERIEKGWCSYPEDEAKEMTDILSNDQSDRMAGATGGIQK